MISIKLDLEREDSAMLRAVERRMQDLRPALKAVGELVRSSIVRNFEVGGRPRRWKPSQRARRQEGQTLLDTRRLRDSIARARIRVTDRSVRLGTNVKYAAVHQFGFRGSVLVPQHVRLVRQAFGSRLKFPVYATVRAHWARRNIPKRPFMMVQREDWEEIRETIRDYLMGA